MLNVGGSNVAVTWENNKNCGLHTQMPRILWLVWRRGAPKPSEFSIGGDVIYSSGRVLLSSHLVYKPASPDQPFLDQSWLGSKNKRAFFIIRFNLLNKGGKGGEG